jgi:hypothetical protein
MAEPSRLAMDVGVPKNCAIKAKSPQGFGPEDFIVTNTSSCSAVFVASYEFGSK